MEKGPESLPLIEQLIEKQGVVFSPLKTRLGEEHTLSGCWRRAYGKDGMFSLFWGGCYDVQANPKHNSLGVSPLLVSFHRNKGNWHSHFYLE